MIKYKITRQELLQRLRRLWPPRQRVRRPTPTRPPAAPPQLQDRLPLLRRRQGGRRASTGRIRCRRRRQRRHRRRRHRARADTTSSTSSTDTASHRCTLRAHSSSHKRTTAVLQDGLVLLETELCGRGHIYVLNLIIFGFNGFN